VEKDADEGRKRRTDVEEGIGGRTWRKDVEEGRGGRKEGRKWRNQPLLSQLVAGEHGGGARHHARKVVSAVLFAIVRIGVLRKGPRARGVVPCGDQCHVAASFETGHFVLKTLQRECVGPLGEL
jgi:hypothetical protein